MNGINSIRLEVNSARHDLGHSRKKIAPVPVIDSAASIESDQKRQSKPEKFEYVMDSKKTEQF